ESCTAFVDALAAGLAKPEPTVALTVMDQAVASTMPRPAAVAVADTTPTQPIAKRRSRRVIFAVMAAAALLVLLIVGTAGYFATRQRPAWSLSPSTVVAGHFVTPSPGATPSATAGTTAAASQAQGQTPGAAASPTTKASPVPTATPKATPNPTPLQPRSISLSSTHFNAVGGSTSVSGSNFSPGTTVTITFTRDTATKQVTNLVGSNGSFVQTLTVTSVLLPGSATIKACDPNGCAPTQTVQVTAL
ncbi:MAG: hypothetical protein M3R21_10130, partial [Candidatus Dormibacteraeota bacterium]|nr:hypothetical protein [Candidatus Dormibacteraeota bacterium]